MRNTAIGLLVSVALVACSGSGDPGSPTPSTTSAVPSSPSSPAGTPTPSASAKGFCADRAVIGDVYREVRAGTIGYRDAAARVAAASKVMRADVGLADAGPGARKLRQFVLYLNTLRLAILGAAENYPGDFAVKQFTNGLVDNVRDLVDALDCPA
jgi:hypothetical protein